MNNIVYKIFKGVFYLVLLCLFTVFVGRGEVQAAEGDNGKLIPIELSNTKVTTYNNEELNPISPWENFKVSSDFHIPKSSEVKNGDKTVIKIPDTFKFGSTYTDKEKKFDIVDKNNNKDIVANAAVDLEKNNLTFTYTDYPSRHAEVNGKFYFYGRVNHAKVSKTGDLDFNLKVNDKTIDVQKINYKGVTAQPKVTLRKEGWQREADASKLRFKIKINADGRYLKNVVVKDELTSEDGVIDTTSFLVQTGEFEFTRAEDGGYLDGVYRLDNDGIKPKAMPKSDYNVEFTPNKKGFTLNFLREILPSDNIRVLYDVNLATTPPNGTLYKNNAILNADIVSVGKDKGQKESSAKFIRKAASYVKTLKPGGEATGEMYSLLIYKYDAENNKPLKDAKFEVYTSDKDGKQYGSAIDTIITDENGYARIDNKLLSEYYLLKEVEAPSGYELASKPVLVKAKKLIAEIKSTKDIIGERISNFKVKTKQLVVEKKWEDSDNNDGLRPKNIEVQLYANGEKSGLPVILNEKNNWKHSFEKLPAKVNGKEIIYTIKEINIPKGYISESNNKDSIVVLTNKHKTLEKEISVEKRWLDENNKDNLRPKNIKVQLYANDKKIGNEVVLKAENFWRHTFKGLKVKEKGVDINYTIKEIDVPKGYMLKVSGEKGVIVLTNIHKPILPPPVPSIPPHPIELTPPPPAPSIPPYPVELTPPPTPSIPPQSVELTSSGNSKKNSGKKANVLAKTGVGTDNYISLSFILLMCCVLIVSKRRINK